ncbi:protease complex subunit PrcB family protein [Clostridium sp.]|uniref:protease complex subunit PrcB family protein n=1 Tax=Clostridium sp. TaxID=1506 RepID=UPI002FCABA03
MKNIMILLLIAVGVGVGVQQPIVKETPRAEQNQGITVNKLKVEYVDTDKAKEIIGDQYSNLIATEGYKLITVGNENYLYIGLGEKPNGGYDLQVSYMEDNEGILNVETKVTQPKADDMVSQVISYPHKVVKVSFGPRKINVNSDIKEIKFKEIKK